MVLAAGNTARASKMMSEQGSKPNKASSTENEHSEHKLSRLEIEVHRGGKDNAVTGHTVKHHFPTSYSKSGAFGEYKEPETYVFDGKGGGSNGNLADHMAEHLPHLFAGASKGGEQKGMIEADNKPGQGDDDVHSTYEA